MAATTLTPAQALRQPRRLDGRAVVGLFLTAISTFGALLFWSTASDTRAVLVATRARPAGAQLGPSDLAVARVRMEDAQYRVAIPAEERAQVVGRQLADPVHAQQVLVRAQVSVRPPLAPEQVAFTIPVSADTAAGLRVRPGDPVQVLATLRKGTAEAHTDTVLERAAVYEVAYDDRRGPSGVPAAGAEGEGIWRGGGAVPVAITLAVSRAEVNRLATARWNGNLDVVILPPEGAPRP